MGTNYKGLYLPVTSEVGWQTLINDNFSTLIDLAGTQYLPAAVGLNEAGTAPSVGGTFPNQYRVHVLPNGSTAGVQWVFCLFHAAATSTFTVRPFWQPQTTDATAHSVRWQMSVKRFDTTGTTTGGVNGVGTVQEWTGDSAVHSGAITYLETGLATTVTVPPNCPVRLAVSRLGGDALDTHVGDINLHGVIVEATGA
jgi:hypothetical protein